MKGGTDYDITDGISDTRNGEKYTIQGYTTTVGDGGKATIDGGTTGASYELLNISGPIVLCDMIWQNNGATGLEDGIDCNGYTVFARVTVHDVEGSGFNVNGGGSSLITLTECEAYNCSLSDTNNQAGFEIANNCILIRCIAHDNTGGGGSNGLGFKYSGFNTGTIFVECIADSNGDAGGWEHGSGGNAAFIRCDAYNNVGNGLTIGSTNDGFPGSGVIENCNFFKNGGWGIQNPNSAIRCQFLLFNNAFGGTGTEANTSGQTDVDDNPVVDSVTYASNENPWADAADGDFSITNASGKNAGRGAFTQEQSGYGDPSPTLGFPDIGAAQHNDAGTAMIVMPRGMPHLRM